MPHPKGEITVDLERRGGKLRAQIDLPPGITGEFVWSQKKRQLHAGDNRIEF